MTGPHEAVRAMPARASLTVGAVLTEYLRVGAGEPVLVLDPSLATRIERGELPARWRGHRLIVPLRTVTESLGPPPPATAPFEAWLDGLLEGLGLSDVTVVAPPRLAAEVYAYAAQHPGEIRGVEVVMEEARG